MDRQEFKQRYLDYLKSDHWRRLRSRCFIRDQKRCVSCGSSRGLNAHHLIYRKLLDCTSDDLLTLCETCHSSIHRHMEENRIKSGSLSGREVIEVLSQSRADFKIDKESLIHFVWDSETQNTGQRLVLLALAWVSNEHACFSVGNLALARAARLSSRAVKKHMRDLRKLRLIECHIPSVDGAISGRIFVPVDFAA